MSTETRPVQQVVRETTVLRINGGWQVGLQMIFEGEYTDAEGKTATGTLARISVWDGKQPQADTLEVHKGSVFGAGQRYQVLEIKEGSSSGQPGTRGGYLVFGQIP